MLFSRYFPWAAFLALILIANPLRAQVTLGQPGQEPGESRQAPPIDPRDYAQKVRIAEVYEETRDFLNATRVYEQLFHTNPSDEIVFEGLTRCLLYLKRYDEAEQIVNDRLAKDGSLDVILISARIEARLNKREQALAQFQKAEQAVKATDCSQVFPIVYAMMDVSYNQDALELLDRLRNVAANDADVCSSQIAGLYLRLGDYDRASREFVSLLKSGEGNVGMVEQRLAQYMTDSMSRAEVLGSLEHEIRAAPPTVANLRVLAWLFQEKKDYGKALDAIVQLDDLAATAHADQTMQGFELLQFADLVRAEGALSIAVKAYDAALARLKTNSSSRNNYFIQQAELGAMKTAEAYYASIGSPKDSVAQLVTRFEQFAARQPMPDLTLDALDHAGELAFRALFDLDRATKNFESALRLSHGTSDAMQRAAFGLVDIAFARQDFPLAERRLAAIEHTMAQHATPSDREIRNHIQYNRALGAYYQTQFDTAFAMLQPVEADAASDYANDAIQLAGIIQENNKPAWKPALTLFAVAALDEASRRYDSALANDMNIVRLFPRAPLADLAALRSAEMLVMLGRAPEAIAALDTMQETMLASPLLDQAAFRAAEITEQNLHDKSNAQRRYEDFLARYPNSIFLAKARDRARKLRGDTF